MESFIWIKNVAFTGLNRLTCYVLMPFDAMKLVNTSTLCTAK